MRRQAPCLLRRLAIRSTSRGLCSIQHLASANKFTFGDATLEYEHVEGATDVIDAVHTVVPESQRGSGAAAKLCDALFAHAHAQSIKVVPTCSYVRDRYVPRHAVSQPYALASIDTSVRGLQIEVAWHGVATLRLTDARRRNPLHVALLEGMHRYLSSLAAAPGTDTLGAALVKAHAVHSGHAEAPAAQPARATESTSAGPTPVGCVVLESSGPVFSSGHDFGDFAGATRSPADVRRVLELCSEVNMLLREIPQASIAAVGGGAYAGGAQLAASCDLVLANRATASFTLTGVHGNGFCHTPAVAYTERLSTHKALELAILGDTIDADEAARIGLANRVVAESEWRAHVDEVAARLAASYGRNIADGKRTLYQQAQAPDLRTKYQIATASMVDMFLSKPWQAHMGRFFQARKKPKL